MFYFKPVHSRSLQTFAAFDPKSRSMTSLKRHFLKNFSTDFSEIFVVNAKLMLEKVLKISCRYLLLILSYRGNPVRGGRISPPPPSGARVKISVSISKSPFSNIYNHQWRAVLAAQARYAFWMVCFLSW